MKKFRIDADNLSWINGEKDAPEDLCLHGHAVVFIDNKRLEYDATVSATALYLLKSITEDHIINEDLQMLPCCGHFIIPNEDLSEVCIWGCNNGVDWTVLHENGQIKIILENGETTYIDLAEYKKEVFCFADKIEKFYSDCSPKKLDGDEFTENCYIAFWNEWHRRRNERYFTDEGTRR
jgi:hypothetical protein